MHRIPWTLQGNLLCHRVLPRKYAWQARNLSLKRKEVSDLRQELCRIGTAEVTNCKSHTNKFVL